MDQNTERAKPSPEGASPVGVPTFKSQPVAGSDTSLDLGAEMKKAMVDLRIGKGVSDPVTVVIMQVAFELGFRAAAARLRCEVSKPPEGAHG